MFYGLGVEVEGTLQGTVRIQLHGLIPGCMQFAFLWWACTYGHLAFALFSLLRHLLLPFQIHSSLGVSLLSLFVTFVCAWV